MSSAVGSPVLDASSSLPADACARGILAQVVRVRSTAGRGEVGVVLWPVQSLVVCLAVGAVGMHTDGGAVDRRGRRGVQVVDVVEEGTVIATVG
jgi:hypothetical protein